MFIDWGSLITTVVTTIVVSGGSISLFFIFFKQRKKKEDSDVVEKDASAALNMLEFANNYHDFTERLVKSYQEAIDRKDEIILNNQSKLVEVETILNQHSKKIEQLNRMIRLEQQRKLYAEQHICLLTECKDRRPALGTFKTVNENINEKTSERTSEKTGDRV